MGIIGGGLGWLSGEAFPEHWRGLPGLPAVVAERSQRESKSGVRTGGTLAAGGDRPHGGAPAAETCRLHGRGPVGEDGQCEGEVPRQLLDSRSFSLPTRPWPVPGSPWATLPGRGAGREPPPDPGAMCQRLLTAPGTLGGKVGDSVPLVLSCVEPPPCLVTGRSRPPVLLDATPAPSTVGC